MQSMLSYQSLKDSFCLLVNRGSLLLVGPFLIFFSLDACTCSSVAMADAVVDFCREDMLVVNVSIIRFVCCIW